MLGFTLTVLSCSISGERREESQFSKGGKGILVIIMVWPFIGHLCAHPCAYQSFLHLTMGPDCMGVCKNPELSSVDLVWSESLHV